jgi:hypothetical protein
MLRAEKWERWKVEGNSFEREIENKLLWEIINEQVVREDELHVVRDEKLRSSCCDEGDLKTHFFCFQPFEWFPQGFLL